MKFITWFWEFLGCSNVIHCLLPGLWSERLCSHFASMMSCLSLTRSQLVNYRDTDWFHTRESTSEACCPEMGLSGSHFQGTVYQRQKSGQELKQEPWRITVSCLSWGLRCSQLCCKAQEEHFLGTSTVHRGLSLPESINNQNNPHRCAHRPVWSTNPSTEIPSHVIHVNRTVSSYKLRDSVLSVTD